MKGIKSVSTIFLIAAFLSLWTIAGAHAQIDRCEGTAQCRNGHADSTSFGERYVFWIPDGAKTDTLQLLWYQKSTDGTPHLKLYYRFGMIKPGGKPNLRDVVLSPDSTALSADFSSEGFYAFGLVGAAKDTLENIGGMKIWTDVIVLTVQGAASNRADTEYYGILMARREDE